MPRAEAWTDRSERPAPWRSSTVLFCVLFLVAIGAGWAMTRLIWKAPSQPVTDADYVAVVAQLYQSDHNAAIARDRLALFGSPDQLVQDALTNASAHPLKEPTDQAALTALATALGTAPVASDPGNASATASAGSAPAAAGGAGAEQPSWVGPIIAFLLALALGGVVLFRTAGLSLSFLKLPGLPFPRLSALPTFRRASGPSDLAADDEDALYRPPAPGQPIGGARSAEGEDDEESEAGPGVAVAMARDGRALVARRPIARPQPVRSVEAPVFQSVYRRGDDPFDEIHPILDPDSGALVGACGLNATLKRDTLNGPRYYGFTAWVQDYVRDEQLFAAGLVTPGAVDQARDEIDAWVKRGQVDIVLPLERGAIAEIGDASLGLSLTILNLELGRDGDHPIGDVAQLTVRFEVQIGA
jgi:hypothetical protein